MQPVPVEGATDVRASARSYNGAVYVIAVNAGTTATNVRFTVPDLGDRTLSVLGRRATLQARGRRLHRPARPASHPDLRRRPDDLERGTRKAP